jgi:hypothetical protein
MARTGIDIDDERLADAPTRRTNHAIMDAALDAGINYFDVGQRRNVEIQVMPTDREVRAGLDGLPPRRHRLIVP